MFLAVVSAGVMIYEKHPGDVALLGESSPLPASQPASHPVLLVGKCCPALPVGSGWGWRVRRGCAGAAVGSIARSSVSSCGAVRWWAACGVRCARKPSQSRVTNSRQGAPFARDLPLQAWFLLSPGMSAVPPRLAL